MNFKKIALAAAAVTMLSGAAMAQDKSLATGSTATDGMPRPGSLLENKEKMAPFYTDETMSTLRSTDEIKSAFQAMSPDDQKMLREECQNVTSPRDTFCQGLSTFE